MSVLCVVLAACGGSAVNDDEASFLLNPETSRPLAGPLDDDTQIREATLSGATEFLTSEDWGCGGVPPTSIEVQSPVEYDDLRGICEAALESYDEGDANCFGEGMLDMLDCSNSRWEDTDWLQLVDDYLEKVTQTKLPMRPSKPQLQPLYFSRLG
jgi:hypothetical protein